MGPFPTFIHVENWQSLETAAERKSSQTQQELDATLWMINLAKRRFLGICNRMSFCLDVGWLLDRQKKGVKCRLCCHTWSATLYHSKTSARAAALAS